MKCTALFVLFEEIIKCLLHYTSYSNTGCNYFFCLFQWDAFTIDIIVGHTQIKYVFTKMFLYTCIKICFMEENNQAYDSSNQVHLLAEENFELNQFEYASQGQRFVNWLIDNLLMRFGLSYVTGMGIGLLLSVTAPDFLAKIVYSDGSMNGSLLFFSLIVGYLNYILYYSICEKLFKGYTLGKLISGSRAIRQDGGELSFKDALLRSLSRCVPFEVFSGFNTLAWHDSWTDTMVVKTR